MDSSKITIWTAFEDCAAECPYKELDDNYIIRAGGVAYYMPDYACKNADLCAYVYERFAKEAK